VEILSGRGVGAEGVFDDMFGLGEIGERNSNAEAEQGGCEDTGAELEFDAAVGDVGFGEEVAEFAAEARVVAGPEFTEGVFAGVAGSGRRIFFGGGEGGGGEFDKMGAAIGAEGEAVAIFGMAFGADAHGGSLSREWVEERDRNWAKTESGAERAVRIPKDEGLCRPSGAFRLLVWYPGLALRCASGCALG